jgi:hypothetical protein
MPSGWAMPAPDTVTGNVAEDSEKARRFSPRKGALSRGFDSRSSHHSKRVCT